MSPVIRNILAILAGVITNTVVVSVAEWLNMRAFPLPAEATSSPARLDDVLRLAPPGVFAGVLAGIVVAALLAGFVTARVAAQVGRQVLVVGLLLVAANVANAFSFWHPAWFRIAAILLPLPLAWLGGRLAHRVPADR